MSLKGLPVISPFMENLISENINTEKFRILLQKEYEERKCKNSSYSLRSFAKSLDIHASCLSVILRGKRPLTNKLVERFLLKLKLSEEKLSFLECSDENSYEAQKLPLDVMSLISDWKHDAILELIKCDEFKSSVEWIARTLELSVTEVQITLERLQRLDLIQNTDGVLKLTHANTEVQISNYTTAALKNYQALALDKSKQALEEVDIEKRYHGSMVMAVDSSRITEAKEALRSFRLEFCNNLQGNEKYNSVYQLQLGFYPLSNMEHQ